MTPEKMKEIKDLIDKEATGLRGLHEPSSQVIMSTRGTLDVSIGLATLSGLISEGETGITENEEIELRKYLEDVFNNF